jgi:signal transduction histidine kinase
VVTGFWVAVGPRTEPHGSTVVLWLLEAALLLVLIVLSVRTAHPRPAMLAALLAGVALSVSLLRFGSLNPQVATGCCIWGLSAVVAALVGGYLRSLDTRRRQAVARGRLQQRLELAGELHDFVAHDVSEILAQAQAAQILAGTAPGRVPDALEQITTAAVRALETLDRTVSGALQHPVEDRPQRANADSIDDITALVQRFQSSGTVDVDLQLHDEAAAALSREAGREVYRAVLEALTNIRRHGAQARQVRILLRTGTTDGQVELSVTDDAPGTAAAGSRCAPTGLGLASLSQRIRELDGTVWAGPGSPSGWRLCVTLPAAPARTAPAAPARGNRSR